MAGTADFLDYWRVTRCELDAAFVQWIPRFFRELPQSETAAIHHALDNGKRLRGCLLCLVNQALGGRHEQALPRAVAVECIQAASLIHDDFVDRDVQRRDRRAAWITYGPRKAVLLGDVMFATALRRMVEASRADGLAVAEVIAAMASGAWQEPLDPGDLDSTLRADGAHGCDLYPTLIHLKTGVLFGTATRLGAISAASVSQLADLAYDYGVHLGEAYQIADDMHDLIGSDGADPGAASLAMLAPAVLHFCGPSALPGGDGAPLRMAPETLALLRERMHEAIRTRLRRATASARQLPDNRFTRLLQSAPSQVVGMIRTE